MKGEKREPLLSAAADSDATGWEDGAWSYPAPGPAGRTTARPLRSRIPPFSQSLALVSPQSGKTAETNPLSVN